MRLYPQRLLCIYEAQANTNITGPNAKANMNILLKDSSVLVPENIYNLSFFVKDGLLLTSNFRLFSMDPDHVHDTSKQAEFLVKFEKKKDKKLQKIKNVIRDVSEKLKALSKEDAEQSTEAAELGEYLQLLEKIKSRFIKLSESSDQEEADKKPKKKPVLGPKIPKKKAPAKDLPTKVKYSKIKYKSSLIKIYSDVNQCFRIIPLSKKMAFDPVNSQFVMCYNGTLRGCTNRVLSETFAFHSTNFWEQHLYTSTFRRTPGESFVALERFSKLKGLTSIFGELLGLIESAHLHCANFPTRVTNWGDLFRFFLSMKQTSGSDKRKINKLKSKVGRIERMKQNKKRSRPVIRPEQIDFYFSGKGIAINLGKAPVQAPVSVRTDPESRFEESSVKTAMILSGKNSILQYLVSHFRRSQNDLKLMLSLSRFLVIWANKFSQLCSRELLEQAEETLFEIMNNLNDRDTALQPVSDLDDASETQPEQMKVVSAGDQAQEETQIKEEKTCVETPETEQVADEVRRNILETVRRAWPLLLTSREKLERWLVVPGTNGTLNGPLVEFIFEDNPFLKNNFPYQNATISVIPKPVPKPKIAKKRAARSQSKNTFQTPKTRKHKVPPKSTNRNKSKKSVKIVKKSEDKIKKAEEPKEKPREKFKDKRDYKFDPLWMADWMWNDLETMRQMILFFVGQIESNANVADKQRCLISVGRILDRMGYLLAAPDGVGQSKQVFKQGFKFLERVFELVKCESLRNWRLMNLHFSERPECVEKIREQLVKFETRILDKEDNSDNQSSNENVDDKAQNEENGKEETNENECTISKLETKEGLVAYIEEANLEECSEDELNLMLRRLEHFDKQHLGESWNLDVLKSMKSCLQIGEKFLFLTLVLLHGPFPKNKALYELLLQVQKFKLSFFKKGRRAGTEITPGESRNWLREVIQDIKIWQLGLDRAEGCSLMEQHILETPHPIERGKTITFPTLVFEGAAGILIEFDRRCQNEENQDQLIFNSYFSSQKKAMNLSSNFNSNTFLANGLRVSGKRTFKQPIFMIGNTLETQFISTATARKNLESLSQWGYKMFVRPYYEFPQIRLSGLERVIPGFLERKLFEEVLMLLVQSARRSCHFTLIEAVSLFKGVPVKGSELEMKK